MAIKWLQIAYSFVKNALSSSVVSFATKQE